MTAELAVGLPYPELLIPGASFWQPHTNRIVLCLSDDPMLAEEVWFNRCGPVVALSLGFGTHTITLPAVRYHDQPMPGWATTALPNRINLSIAWVDPDQFTVSALQTVALSDNASMQVAHTGEEAWQVPSRGRAAGDAIRRFRALHSDEYLLRQHSIGHTFTGVTAA